MLTTSTDVIRRTGIATLPQYQDVGPMSDCPGFYGYRSYPPGSPLEAVVTVDGRPAVQCLIQFIVDPPKHSSSISRTHLHTRLSRKWNRDLIFSTLDPDAMTDHPDAPSAESAVNLKNARRPLDLDFRDDYVYDGSEDVFLDDDGKVVTPEQMLAHAYTTHCKTYQWRFLWRWKLDSGLKFIIKQSVWLAQDAAMWFLFNLYDVELRDKELRSPFHKYEQSEFRRITEKEGERSHFFGFQSSQKSLFTNLVIVAIACWFVYVALPHRGFIRAIYNNPALTTAALVFSFLVADFVGPWLIIRVICLLSRLREHVLFLIRKVKV